MRAQARSRWPQRRDPAQRRSFALVAPTPSVGHRPRGDSSAIPTAAGARAAAAASRSVGPSACTWHAATSTRGAALKTGDAVGEIGPEAAAGTLPARRASLTTPVGIGQAAAVAAVAAPATAVTPCRSPPLTAAAAPATPCGRAAAAVARDVRGAAAAAETAAVVIVVAAATASCAAAPAALVTMAASAAMLPHSRRDCRRDDLRQVVVCAPTSASSPVAAIAAAAPRHRRGARRSLSGMVPAQQCRGRRQP